MINHHTWGFPLDQACVEQGGLCGQGDLKVAVGVVVEHDVRSPDVVRGGTTGYTTITSTAKHNNVHHATANR